MYNTMQLCKIFRYPLFLFSFLVSCYGSLKTGFSLLQRGHRLDGKVIQSYAEISFLDCVTECLVTPLCKSINYFKGANFCESNYENKTTAETRYMESSGWVYSEKEHWPKVNGLESLITTFYTMFQYIYAARHIFVDIINKSGVKRCLFNIMKISEDFFI